MQYFSEDYLEHHGIPGQKWGVRRYQNPDGSLTDKGKKRVAKLNSKVDTKYQRKTNRARKDIAAVKEYENTMPHIKKRGRTTYINNDYLKYLEKGNKAYNKIQYQKKLKDIRKSEISKGFDYYEHDMLKSLLISELIGTDGATMYTYAATKDKYADGLNARANYKDEYKKANKDKEKLHSRYLDRW